MKDVTTRVLDELNDIPGTTDRPGLSRMDNARPLIQAYCERYVSEDANNILGMTDNELWEYWRTADKRIFNFDFDTQEKEIRLLQIADDSVLEQELQVVNVKIDPDFETIILEREGNVFPKLIAVSLPKSMDISLYSESGIPFHIYFHPTLGQNLADYYTATNMPGRESLKSLEDQNFIPYGWDFLFFIIFNNLTYKASSNIGTDDKIDIWAGKGLLYQITNSLRNIVNIIPVLDPTHNAGDFENPDSLQQILEEIQQFIVEFLRLQGQVISQVGKSAISAFSSGHLGFNNLLSHAAQVDISNLFFGNTLQEVYMFDAPAGTNDQWVTLANSWAQKYGEEKVVRAYSQWKPKNVNLLLARDQQPAQGKVVVNSENPNRSFALLGASFFKEFIADSGWQAIHQAIPALMLNDALIRSHF